MIRLAVASLVGQFLAGLLMLVGIHGDAVAQQSTVPTASVQTLWSGGVLVYLHQGEKRPLTEDFVAYLHGDSLHITLDARGQITPDAPWELMVSLIQPGVPRADVRLGQDGHAVFERVRQGLAAIVVTADSMAATGVVSLYAAMPIFIAGTVPDRRGDVAIPLAAVDPEELAAELVDARPGGGTVADLPTINDYRILPTSRFRVLTRPDGSVQGNIVVPQRGYEAVIDPVRVSLYKDGQLLTTTMSDRGGAFVLPNVAIGVNSLVVTGAAGHAAYSIEVVEPVQEELIEPTAKRSSPAQQRLVALVDHLQPPVGESLLVVLIPPALMPEVQETVEQRRRGGVIIPPPVTGAASGALPVGGGIGGAGGFGGGGGGAMSGIGAMLGAAGLAVGIAAASDDDGFTVPVASPVSQ
ncbi:MAG: hypothetical protein KatS3mg111_3296 [Pirellulaceae bacterium]|nr:MAG: hypothetical protein KatS3mg111_3296 [Pirellulaceae bacterium]